MTTAIIAGIAKGLHSAHRKTGKASDLSFLRRQESVKILDSGSSQE
jgi:hypothetical protein